MDQTGKTNSSTGFLRINHDEGTIKIYHTKITN